MKKKDFQLKQVEVIVAKPEGDEIRTIKPSGTDWHFLLSKDEINNARIRVTDAADSVRIVLVVSEGTRKDKVNTNLWNFENLRII